MKFAHLADCHIGGWREQKLKDLSIQSFEKAIEHCIKEYVGFIIIAGDLFDTALPQIDLLKETTRILKKVKEQDIPVYIIPGSHDFSTSGKTMLDVLEQAGLLENVMKLKDPQTLEFTIDRTGTKLTGILGRKQGLEVKDYEELNRAPLEKEEGFKIFLFHSLLNELKPKDLDMVEGTALSLLPKNFNYYAGGHPHFIYSEHHEGYGRIAYPGPTFPNNFKELEQLKHGGFWILETSNNQITPRHIPLPIKETKTIYIDANNKTPEEIEEEIQNIQDIEDKILTIRIEGTLRLGKPTDIKFREAFTKLNNAYCILKNTHKLQTKQNEAEQERKNIHLIEEEIIQEACKNITIQKEIIKNLLEALYKEKLEGEKSIDFEKRILKEAELVLGRTL